MNNIGDRITVANFKGRDEVKNIILSEYENAEYLSAEEIVEKIGTKIVDNIRETEDIEATAEELENGRDIS